MIETIKFLNYEQNVNCSISFDSNRIKFTFLSVVVSVSGILIVLDDVLRWRLCGEEKPRYYIHGKLIFDMSKHGNK